MVRKEPSPYRLKFEDHFDGNTLNNTKWYLTKPTYTVQVINSMLILGPSGVEVRMQQTYHFRYGYVEILAKLGGTLSNENSNSSSLWTYPSQDNPRYEEIDLTETSTGIFNNNKIPEGINKINIHIHTPLQPISYGFIRDTGLDLSINFHKYAFDWSPEYVIFYFDDIEIGKIMSSQISIPRGKLQICFNLCRRWIGSTNNNCWPTTIETATEDATMYIDYIKIYQKM